MKVMTFVNGFHLLRTCTAKACGYVSISVAMRQFGSVLDLILAIMFVTIPAWLA